MKDYLQRKTKINNLLGYIVFLLLGLFVFSGCTQSTKVIDDTKDQTMAVEEVETKAEAKTIMATMSEISEDGTIKINVEDYPKPNQEKIKSMLTELQYEVTQNEGTEQAFTNDYHDNKEVGIYVDIVTGEPLFSSLDKYDSKTGWPSFTKPLVDEVITLHEDNGIFGSRVEVRSRIGDSHLGHVFEDGPKDRGGLRYCMNGASLRFIPLVDLEVEGYGYLASLFN